MSFSHNSCDIALVNKFFYEMIKNERTQKKFNSMVIVRTLKGNTLMVNFEFNLKNTVLDYKKNISELYPKYKYFQNITIIFKGKIMKDEDLFIKYSKGIREICCLHLLYHNVYPITPCYKENKWICKKCVSNNDYGKLICLNCSKQKYL